MSEPTRITKKSKTLPDNCVTNIDYSVALNWDPGLSDHAGQRICLDLCNHKYSLNKKRLVARRNFSQSNRCNLSANISYYCSNKPNTMNEQVSVEFQKFNDDICNLVNVCCPLIKVKSNSNNLSLMHNTNLMEMSEEKKHFHLLHKLTGEKSLKRACNRASKNLKKAIYAEKKDCMTIKSTNLAINPRLHGPS